MRKNTRSNIIVTGIIVLILGSLIALAVFNQGKSLSIPLGYQCSGGQVLSISNAQLYTSSDLGGKKVIRVTFSTLPSSECLYINLKPSDINSKLSDSDKAKFQATNTILGDIKLLNEQKIYNINERSSEKFKKFDIRAGNRNSLGFCTDSKCKEQFGSDNFINSPTPYTSGSTICGADDCCCNYFVEKGVNGEFSISESFRWKVQIDIGSENPLILTNNQLSGKIGNIAFANWGGNLVSNDNLGSITNRQAYKPYSDNQWRMTDLVWQDLKNKFDTNYAKMLTCEGSTGIPYCSDSDFNQFFGYNSEFDTKTTNHLGDWVKGNSIISSAQMSSNQLIVNLKSAVVYPTFTLDIDANEVGIFISSGIPQVTCPSNIPKMVSGQTYDANFNLKNIGSDSGSFTYSVSCNKGSQYLQPSPPQQISSGSSKSISGRLGLTVPNIGTDTASCTFTATDVQSCRTSCKTDSCAFSYTAEHQSDCIAGTKSCELGNTELWTCKSDGSYDKIKCEYGCSYENGEYKCKSDGGGGNGTEECSSCWNWLKDKIGIDQSCKTGFIDKIKNALFCPFYFLGFALLIVVSLVSLLFGQQSSNKFFKNIPVWATWLIGLFVAGLTFGIGYIFLAWAWWYILILLAVVIVIGVIINMIPGAGLIKKVIKK